MNSNLIANNKIPILVGIFLFFLCIYTYICFFCVSDLSLHVDIALNKLQQNRLFNGNFILYFLMHLFSFFSINKVLVGIALSVLLAMATSSRIYILKEHFQSNGIQDCPSWIFSFSTVFLFVVPFFFVFSCWYKGFYVPNVWHNSTTIFLFPFAILLYLASLHIFERKEIPNRTIAWLVFLVFCNVFIKPSFFFVWCVAYPIILLSLHKFTANFWKGLIPLFCGLVFLAIEYLSIYNNASDGSYVYFDFSWVHDYTFYRYKMPRILWSLFFPLLCVCRYGKSMVKDREFWFLCIMLIMSLGVYFTIHEGGPRSTHGNFYWQIIIIINLCFVYTLKKVLAEITNNSKKMIGFVYEIIYLLHVFGGIMYLLYFLISKEYMC